MKGTDQKNPFPSWTSPSRTHRRSSASDPTLRWRCFARLRERLPRVRSGCFFATKRASIRRIRSLKHLDSGSGPTALLFVRRAGASRPGALLDGTASFPVFRERGDSRRAVADAATQRLRTSKLSREVRVRMGRHRFETPSWRPLVESHSLRITNRSSSGSWRTSRRTPSRSRRDRTPREKMRGV